MPRGMWHERGQAELLPGGLAGAVISSRGFMDCIASPQIALLGGAALHLASLTLERNEAKSEEGD